MARWIIDVQHSDVHFKTRHLVISSVTGAFKKFEGSVETSNDDLTNAKISFSADVASIDTNNEKRDADLRAVDFFDVAKFPKLYFESTSFYHVKENEYKLTGKLTIKGVSNMIDLKVISGGKATDLQGKERVGYEISGSLNRCDYGLVWSLLTESGAIVLGEEVKIHINVQLMRAAEQQQASAKIVF